MATSTRTYRDLDLNFTRNPATKDVAIRVGEQAVIRSLRNLIYLSHYEKPFHPEIGSSVTQMLFEQMTPLTAQELKNKIIEVITNFEPRVKIDQVIVQSSSTTSAGSSIPLATTLDMDSNQFEVYIRFYLLNSANPIETTLFLERVR